MYFAANLNSLPQMLGFIYQSAKQAHLIDSDIHKCELASEEVLVNIISYAYSKDNEQKNSQIEITCRSMRDKFFEISFRDWGIPFDPIDAEVHVDFNRSLDERPIGGLGIYLIRHLMDEVSYQRIGEENLLKMLLRLNTKSG